MCFVSNCASYDAVALFRNPHYYYHLPLSLAMQHGSRTLSFILDHQPTRISRVTVNSTYEIEDLKKAIKKKLPGNVSAIQMILWKVNTPIPLNVDTNQEMEVFANKIRNIRLDPDSADPPGIIQLRNPNKNVASYWEDPPPQINLHLIVQLLSDTLAKKRTDDKRPVKKQRLGRGNQVPRDMQMLWDQTWNREEEAIPWFTLKETKRDDTSTTEVPERSWVLSPPQNIAEALGLKPPTVLFRDDYLRAFGDLFASSGLGYFNSNLDRYPQARFPNFFSGVQVTQKAPYNAFILTGHPGIGKSIWLRILLILRLCARLPTFYATNASTVFFFTGKGPVEISLNSSDLRFYLREGPAWALFDSTPSLMEPPYDFIESMNIFVVQTPSPRARRIEWRKKNPPIKVFCLELWSVAELICAAPFQQCHHQERDLVEFCKKYGYSARDAYANAGSLDTFESTLQAYCDSLSYDSAAQIVSNVQMLHFPEDVSYNILCIKPIDAGLQYTFDFTSEHVYNCVLHSLRDSQVDAAAKFYRLFLKILRKTRSVAGYMLEPAADNILGNGGSFEIIQLEHSIASDYIHWKTPQNFTNRILTLHITSACILVGEGRELAAEHSTSFLCSSPSSTLSPSVGNICGQPPVFEFLKFGQLAHFGIYYPSSKTQATFDFLAYDPKDKHAWIFEVTTSPSQTVKVKDIQDLINRGIDKISYIAVTSGSPSTIDLAFPIALDDIVTQKYQLRLR